MYSVINSHYKLALQIEEIIIPNFKMKLNLNLKNGIFE